MYSRVCLAVERDQCMRSSKAFYGECDDDETGRRKTEVGTCIGRCGVK